MARSDLNTLPRSRSCRVRKSRPAVEMTGLIRSLRLRVSAVKKNTLLKKACINELRNT